MLSGVFNRALLFVTVKVPSALLKIAPPCASADAEFPVKVEFFTVRELSLLFQIAPPFVPEELLINVDHHGQCRHVIGYRSPLFLLSEVVGKEGIFNLHFSFSSIQDGASIVACLIADHEAVMDFR